MATWMQRVLIAIAVVAVWSSPSFAQSATSITGTVRDASGAVLPGVTVRSFQPGADRADADDLDR